MLYSVIVGVTDQRGPILEKQVTKWGKGFLQARSESLFGWDSDRAIEGIGVLFQLSNNLLQKERMISILTQERLLGASLGVLLTGVVVFEQRRYIYASISDNQSQVKEPIFGKKSRSEFAHAWNKTVDQTFGPLIKSLSSRGW
ncbi:hypothetical protein VNO78_05683 [Psophocarpus tetragonolobus]|uniref:Uncharacterized protein n=1 Tax=Psophocarpus tetragonolobus TaxID=3891 RepID=A0AAN9T143_PSOTE